MSTAKKIWRTCFRLGGGEHGGCAKIAIFLSVAVLCSAAMVAVGVRKTSAINGVCDNNGCAFCHGDEHGANWAGCSGCHDSPPQTGTHTVHYGSAPLVLLTYGDAGVTSDADNYKFGCGNCHPLDVTKHRDGILEVELSNASAPAGSIKAQNPSDAAYTPGSNITTYPGYTNTIGSFTFSYSNGTCSNVYCHSGKAVFSSSAVPGPTLTPPNLLSYGPYTVSSGRIYQTTPAWGSTFQTQTLRYKSQTANFTVGNTVTGMTSGAMGTIVTNNNEGTAGVLTLSGISGTFTDGEIITSSGTGSAMVDGGLGAACTQCHQFPLATAYPSVQAGVGDSHSWTDDYGYVDLHAWNMGYGYPVMCMTCHYGTVNQANSYKYTDLSVIYDPIPLASRVYHVNGMPDVIFDVTHTIQYTDAFSLGSATYNPETKTCSNVSCHLQQTSVTWGSPYRWWNSNECTLCHLYGIR